MAQSGHDSRASERPLSGVKRTGELRVHVLAGPILTIVQHTGIEPSELL
jgi:hypothetical protein